MIPRYEKCTIWTLGKRDPLTGLDSVASTRVYACEAAKGGKVSYSDSKGSEFYPKSTFWVRSGDILSGTHSEPREGEMIARGDFSGDTNYANCGAETIKGVSVHSNAKFGQPDSYTIGTE